MLDRPSRIEGLIERLERGETVTQDEVDRIAALQQLDLAAMGERFARDSLARDAEATAELLRHE